MLGDTARKLLRILYHYSGHYRRMPDMQTLRRLSGRTYPDVIAGMSELAERRYIAWRRGMRVERAALLEAWERPEELPASRRGGGKGHWLE